MIVLLKISVFMEGGSRGRREIFRRKTSVKDWIGELLMALGGIFFPHFRLEHLPHSISDHCPLPLSMTAIVQNSDNHWHFHFEAVWLTEETCEEEVGKHWDNATRTLMEKLRAISLGLEVWFQKIRKDKKLTEAILKKKLGTTDDILEELIHTKLALNLEAHREE
ncbi:hypothetical protein F3Y22_tig00112281pilonHSYRG00103 [Hibiscus syriacus]|uniref:Reverse transcriptase n=1 Tax=Hibiscus syriacus TaxID=106335 RepID=A0A6A2XGN7_HIBSY|nr:hypothetical protein F3Y22_tig00112281pilonHSYRG00103 [Hibiscus syriacus]